MGEASPITHHVLPSLDLFLFAKGISRIPWPAHLKLCRYLVDDYLSVWVEKSDGLMHGLPTL